MEKLGYIDVNLDETELDEIFYHILCDLTT